MKYWDWDKLKDLRKERDHIKKNSRYVNLVLEEIIRGKVL